MEKAAFKQKHSTSMATTASTPLWLDLKKEYIDDNFEKLLSYLKNKQDSRTNDSFYHKTIDLLKERITELIQQIASRPIYGENPELEQVKFNARLLASYLLIENEGGLAFSAYVAFIRELMILSPKFADRLIQTAIERLKHEKIINLSFYWHDIMDFKPEAFIYKVTKNSRFANIIKKPLVFEHYGTALLSEKGLYLTREKKNEAQKLLTSGARSLDTQIGIAIRTASNEKCKQSSETNIPLMDDYIKDFLHLLQKTKKREAKTVLKYVDGDEVIIRVTSVDRNRNIIVETVDDNYEQIHGVITFDKPNIIYYYTNDFARYFRAGDFLKAKVKDAENGYFGIEDSFIAFVIEDCREQYSLNTTEAKVICKTPTSIVWMNERGVPFYSRMNDNYAVGDCALLQIKEYCTGAQYGKIHASVVERIEDIDISGVQKDCIIAFAEDISAPDNVMSGNGQLLSANVLRILPRMLYEYQKQLLKPSERYHFLANARIMSEIVGDESSATYIGFCSTYLRLLIQFVNNESVANITLEVEEEFKDAKDTFVRLSVLKLLKEYGKTENSEVLATAISENEEKIPILARLARLIQTANSLRGNLSDAGINVIKREIIKTLSLETVNDTDLEADSGTYLGLESSTQEFKTSFVYPSGNNMQPAEKTQELNVFRGVCAFMNSETGGTLYLGVNDQGYVVGLDDDMRFLHMTEIDTYQRHIQDRAKHYFDTDGIVHLRMEPLYDNKVIAIHVEPHPYRVVELDGVAYLRVNAESREMPEKVKQEMIARKVFTDKNKAAAISMLQQACDRKLQVILHKYSSGNSATIQNRRIEAYKVIPQEGVVMGCDVENVNFACKVFNIDRIGYVEILHDRPWEHEASHKEILLDAFHWSGEKPISVSLKLNLTAKNLLVEEYPRTRKDLTEDKKNPGTWYLNTTVYNIIGVARFYAGLANCIEILDCPELKAYIEDYKQYL